MSDFKSKMHQIRFRLRSAPDPAGGAYSTPSDPRWIYGVLLLRVRGKGREREGRAKRTG